MSPMPIDLPDPYDTDENSRGDRRAVLIVAGFLVAVVIIAAALIWGIAP